MVSILGDYNYEFPKPRKLETKLRDLLEQDVPEKYFLSEKQIEQIQNWNAYEKPLETMEKIERERISPTLTTRTGAFAAGMVLVKDTNKMPIKNATKQGYLIAEEGDGIDIGGRMETHRGTVQKNKAQTILTGGGSNGVCVKKSMSKNELGIRKLTPRECFRLMGVKDNDFDKIAKNQSDDSLYHLAGDSIVVDVLMAIYGELIEK